MIKRSHLYIELLKIPNLVLDIWKVFDVVLQIDSRYNRNRFLTPVYPYLSFFSYYFRILIM